MEQQHVVAVLIALGWGWRMVLVGCERILPAKTPIFRNVVFDFGRFGLGFGCGLPSIESVTGQRGAQNCSGIMAFDRGS